MGDTKELAKATDSVEQNTFPWLSSDENPAKALEEPLCSDSASCDDLITRITDEFEGEELLPEVKENWWANVDDINWEWMFPTISDSDKTPVCDAKVEEKPCIMFDFTCSDPASCSICKAEESAPPSDGANNNPEVPSVTDEPIEGEELLPEIEDSLWVDVEGIGWDWIDPNLSSDSDNDNSPVQLQHTQVEDDAQPRITFDNCVAVAQDTFQELNTLHRGDIRSPSEITPIPETDSWVTSPSSSEAEKLRTVHSISQGIQKVSKCPFLSNLGKISNNNTPPNSLGKPDPTLLSMLKDLAAKLRDLANDINAIVGRLAVESTSDAWIESVFSTTRSVDGSLECKTSLSSNASSAAKEHVENVGRDGSWDEH